MNNFAAESLGLVNKLLERIESVDIELMAALADPTPRDLDELLRRRQDCISALDGIDTSKLPAQGRAPVEIVRKIKQVQKTGESLLEMAVRRRDELAALRRQNAVTRRTARGYRPPRLRLVVDRRIQA